MFIFIILFFIIYVVSFVYLFYKINLLEDDVETLYDNYSDYIKNNFRSDKNV